MVKLFGILTILFNGIALFASDGTLPVGREKKKDGVLDIINGPAKATRAHGIDCERVFFQRDRRDQLLSSMEVFYFPSRLKKALLKGVQDEFLLAYDAKEKRVVRVSGPLKMAAKHMVPLDKRVSGMAFLSLKDDDSCQISSGKGVGMRLKDYADMKGVSLSSPSIAEVLKPALYGIASEDGMPIVVDYGKSATVAVDSRSFQRRIVRRVPKEHFLLSHHKTKNRLTLIKPSQKEGAQILRSEAVSFETVAQINLGLSGENKILQSRSRFAFINKLPEKNALLIKEVKHWTGRQDGRYKLTLPADYKTEDFYYEMDFRRGRAIVYSYKNTRLQQAFMVNYKKNKVLGTLDIPRGLYVAHAFHRLKGTGAVFILKSIRDKSLAAISHFHYKTKKWYPIKLAVE